MPRLFTGLEIPSSIAQSLGMMRGGLPGARWLDPENYHLTLRFIGDIDDALAREIAGVLDRVHRRPFELRLDGLTSFGGRKPRAVVAAAAAVTPLMELQAEHERLLQRLGLEPEGRKYTPHVTLARLRDCLSHQVADYLAARGHYRSASFPVTRFVLFSSRAAVGGGPYIAEEIYPLTRRSADSREAGIML
ncbi:MAG: RNA 2',3'-cyclic phosphodiesterase [Xanthobacteraceae bacterium]